MDKPTNQNQTTSEEHKEPETTTVVTPKPAMPAAPMPVVDQPTVVAVPTEAMAQPAGQANFVPQQLTNSDNTTMWTIFTIILLWLFYPVGLIVMWLTMKTWPMWVKILLTLLPLLFIVLAVVFVMLGGAAQYATRPTP